MKLQDKFLTALRLVQFIAGITPILWLVIIACYLLVQNAFLATGLTVGFIATIWSIYIWLPITIILLIIKKRPLIHPATLLIPIVSIILSFVIIGINPGWVFDDWLG